MNNWLKNGQVYRPKGTANLDSPLKKEN